MAARAPISPAEVTLSVADLDRSLDYYENAIGLGVNSREDGTARGGVTGRDLLVLEEQPGARPGRGTNTGLFPFALLVPETRDLARWPAPLAGSGLHLTRTSRPFASD